MMDLDIPEDRTGGSSGVAGPSNGGTTLDSLRSQAADTSRPSAIDERRRVRATAVPTDDGQVRTMLRQLGEAITLFGERQPERRQRLKFCIALREGRKEEGGGDIVGGSESESDDEEEAAAEDEEEEFYTEGSRALLNARQSIATFSLQRARARIARQKIEATVPLARIFALRKEVYEPLKHFANLGSQIGDDRPISIVRFSPDSTMLATGSWSGSVKLWDCPSANAKRTLRAHNDRVGGLAWHPRATLSQSAASVNLVTGAADAKVCLWNLESDRPISTLSGHTARVARTAFHPSGSYVASASFDGTWRLWDVEKGTELLLQEGHSKEVYAIDFQDDGALVASAGLDAIGRVWDTRTGRTAMVLHGHAREILSLDFSPNGYQVATASGDDTVRIWDLRAVSAAYTIPAHTSSVADVRFFRAAKESPVRREAGMDMHADVEMADAASSIPNGHDTPDNASNDAAAANPTASAPQIGRTGLYLATAGYDGLVKVWSADDWQLLRSLSGDAGKVMSVDISADGQYLASGEWGRTFKLWGNL